MKATAPAWAGASCDGRTVRVSGSVVSRPTSSAGTASAPSSRGCSATANSERTRVWPLTISTRRVLVCPLTSKSASSGDQSGVSTPRWSVSTFRVAVSPDWIRSRSSHARVSACADRTGTSSIANSRVVIRNRDIGSVCPFAAAAFMLEPEPGAQQAARIVGNPPQPGFGGLAPLALAGVRRRLRRGLRFVPFLTVLFQRALHLFAQGLVGFALAVGIGRFGRLFPAVVPVAVSAAALVLFLLILALALPLFLLLLLLPFAIAAGVLRFIRIAGLAIVTRLAAAALRVLAAAGG